jgi:hypothetical protein
MADFIIPDHGELAEILVALGLTENTSDFEAGLVMLAARPAGGATWKIQASTGLSLETIRKWEAAMQREGVWPGLDSWASETDDGFMLDLFSVTGKLRRIVYGSGEVRYIDARQLDNSDRVKPMGTD